MEGVYGPSITVISFGLFSPCLGIGLGNGPAPRGYRVASLGAVIGVPACTARRA